MLKIKSREKPLNHDSTCFTQGLIVQNNIVLSLVAVTDNLGLLTGIYKAVKLLMKLR